MPVNVASPDCAESFYRGRCTDLVRAGSLAELRAVLDGRSPGAPTTLDLIGHSTRQHHLLRLGRTPIDMLDRTVARFFRTLAEDQVLPGLGITGVRLLGCETAVTESGRLTMRLLAHTLRLPVFGTTVPLMKSHSGAAGFNPAFSHVLVEVSVGALW